jgi:hypothetical protein
MPKTIEIRSLIIERIIVHDIQKHLKGDLSIEPTYSEMESSLTDGLRNFFKEKVVSALISDKSFKICFDEDNASPISWLVPEIIKSNDSDFVSHSKKIARHLFEIQVGLNVAGILVIILGRINSINICIILKLERDKGAQLKLDAKTKSFNIAEVQDLMLTQKTKIFKVALFLPRDSFKAKFDGIIMDYQIDITAKKEVTTWFIEKFLGCKAFEDPKITTQHFYNYTRQYIATIENPLDRAKYIQDLNSYVQRNITTLSPLEFADEYLSSTEHRENYKNYLDSKKFSFSGFLKDNCQIEGQIKKIVLEFENEISIIGKKGTFNKNVKLDALADGTHRAEIISKIKKIV